MLEEEADVGAQAEVRLESLLSIVAMRIFDRCRQCSNHFEHLRRKVCRSDGLG